MSLPQDLHRLYRLLPSHRRQQLLWLFILMLLTATSEVISLGAVLPFLGALSNANGVLQNPTFQPLWQKLEVSTTFHLVLWLAGTFGMAVILANILRIITLRSQLRFAAAIASELSCEVYRRVLYQPYSFHVRHSSNELIAGITSDISLVSSTILPQTLLLAVNTMIVIALVLSVVIISPGIAIGTAVTLGVSYWILLEVSKRTLSSNSYTITSQNRFLIKYLQEGLGGIRDVILERNQGIFVNSYRQVDRPLRLAVANNALISSVPRYIIEPIAMVAICTIAVVMAYQQEQLARVVPILGALALAANRLLPALQGCFASIASLRGNQASLEKVLEKLAIPVDMLPIPQGMGKALNQSLQLRNVWFRYSPSTPWVLRDLCLEIKANTTVGFIGTTGSGKSTTADLILGLLQPEKGEILVDGELLEGERLANWQRTIAHVPQSIFLSDATIAENIAFGVPLAEIDMERVQEAARLAQIADFIEGREGGYEEIVGERGIRLSGGQRQRIGIARALYKRAS
ncbi:ATP-binding cassette domain-containing protein, partial [Cylindrospermopsis raciborskii]